VTGAAGTLGGAAIMAADGMVLRPGAEPFDLELPAGQILGLAGLEGHGQVELLEVLCGLRKPERGALRLDGEELGGRGLRDLHDAARRGIAYLPRDRKAEGILPTLSVLDNFAIATLRRESRFGILRSGRIRRRYEEFAAELGIVAADPGASIRTLSGGNQQKVLLARWLAADPRVLLLNDPSRGVDHRTRLSLHALYRQLAAQGACVVLLSTEIEELLLVADAVTVFREFSVSGRLAGSALTRDAVLTAMFGGVDRD
jgi:ABC-type sugar transport system ATPase subunit